MTTTTKVPEYIAVPGSRVYHRARLSTWCVPGLWLFPECAPSGSVTPRPLPAALDPEEAFTTSEPYRRPPRGRRLCKLCARHEGRRVELRDDPPEVILEAGLFHRVGADGGAVCGAVDGRRVSVWRAVTNGATPCWRCWRTDRDFEGFVHGLRIEIEGGRARCTAD